MKANMADYLLLDSELSASVQGNLMDEMLISIIQGHAQRLGVKTIAGPVALPLVMDTLSAIGVDLDGHLAWLVPLLEEYYDPMYRYQLEKKAEKIVFRGEWAEVPG